jgi:hypothetical protein
VCRKEGQEEQQQEKEEEKEWQQPAGPLGQQRRRFRSGRREGALTNG